MPVAVGPGGTSNSNNNHNNTNNSSSSINSYSPAGVLPTGGPPSVDHGLIGGDDRGAFVEAVPQSQTSRLQQQLEHSSLLHFPIPTAVSPRFPIPSAEHNRQVDALTTAGGGQDEARGTPDTQRNPGTGGMGGGAGG